MYLGLVCHGKLFKCLRPIGQGKHSPHPSLSGGALSGQGGDVALNALARANLGLKLSLSCRALKQLECMAKLRVSF